MKGLSSTILRDRERLVFLFLFLLALALRLWGLDWRAIHYDESIHAHYSWKLSTGEGYKHNPLMHGPFQFHITALSFLLLGDSEFTARLPAAILGSLIIALVYFMRHELGRGAVLVAILFTLSPTMLYLSRFARADIYFHFFTLLLLFSLWRYIRERRPRYLYIGAAALSLSFATKETAYVMVVIILSFLFIFTARELWQAILKRDLSSISPTASFFLLIFTLSLPQFSASISLLQSPLGLTLANKNLAMGPEGAPLGTGVWVAAGVLLFLFILSMTLGLLWQPKRWLISALIFYTLYILLFSTFLTNPQGLGTGIWGSLAYWLVQHAKGRIEQPLFYYPLLLSIYEFIPLILALPASIYYLKRGNGFPLFLVYWSFLSLALYSYIGEKTPWLVTNMTLPLILLSGKFGGELLLKRWLWRGIILSFLIISLPFYVKTTWQANYQKHDHPVEMLVFAQASQEIKEIKIQMEKWAKEGKRISIDSCLKPYPWQWYLRHYKNVDYPNLSRYYPKGEVVVVSPANEGKLRRQFNEYKRYKHLLWFPEEYKVMRLPKMIKWWWKYFLFRDVKGYWTSQGILYLR